MAYAWTLNENKVDGVAGRHRLVRHAARRPKVARVDGLIAQRAQAGARIGAKGHAAEEACPAKNVAALGELGGRRRAQAHGAVRHFAVDDHFFNIAPVHVRVGIVQPGRVLNVILDNKLVAARVC